MFEKVLSKPVLGKANDKQLAAYNSIVNARKSITDAVKINKGDEKVTELLKSDSMKNAFKDLKKLLPKAKVQAMLIGAVVAGVLGALVKIVFGQNTPKTK